jgi:peptidoglycan-associated lipoprotein
MKTKQWIPLIIMGCGVLTLTACSSAHKNRNAWAVNDANAANYNDDAQSSGLGDEANVAEQDTGSAKHVATKKVYYVDFDSDVVHADDRPAIEANADRLTAAGSSKVMLEGHTDPRGSREYNIGLGERRAKSVAELMTTKGASPKQIRIVSYGAEKLASTGHSDSDYQQDRRVVLVNTQS